MLPSFDEMKSDENIHSFALLQINPLMEKSLPVAGFHILDLEIKLIVYTFKMILLLQM